MDSIGVVIPQPTFPYLEQRLDNRLKLFRPWKQNPQNENIQFPGSIRAAVVNSVNGAGAELIEAFPNLEIVSCYGVGVDKIDLKKCVEKGIRVTNTPDALTDEAADLAIGLILALLRGLCECDRYVRSGKWKQADYNLTTKTS